MKLLIKNVVAIPRRRVLNQLLTRHSKWPKLGHRIQPKMNAVVESVAFELEKVQK